MIVNSEGPIGKAQYFSGKAGQIIETKNKLEKYLFERKGTSCNIMYFNSTIEAENCKISMKNPLLRFFLIKKQTNHHITPGIHYKYIPNIDWSDDRVKTDEGLLEVCGCPKDKCKEYADYCKKVIEDIDNKGK